MADEISNPWAVTSIESFNYLCCPECVFRSKEELSFYPSNTCAQLAFSKLKISWQEAIYVSIHGRDSTKLIEALKSKPSSLAIITDSNNNGLEIIQNNLLELNLDSFYDSKRLAAVTRVIRSHCFVSKQLNKAQLLIEVSSPCIIFVN